MKLASCYVGHRFRLPHWGRDQYYDVKFVGRSHVVVEDETGKQSMIDRDDMSVDWIHLGATPKSGT